MQQHWRWQHSSCLGNILNWGVMSGGARFVGVDSGRQLQRTAMNRVLCQPYQVVIKGLCAIFELTATLILTICQRGAKWSVGCWEDFACGWWWWIWKLPLSGGSRGTVDGVERVLGGGCQCWYWNVLPVKWTLIPAWSGVGWEGGSVHGVGMYRSLSRFFSIRDRNTDMKSALLMGMNRSKRNKCPFLFVLESGF